MDNLYARSVFFVQNAERSLRFYLEQLGFALDWDSNDGVLQVSLFGFELILNEVDEHTRGRAGHGRVFIGLGEDQAEPFRKHISTHGVQTLRAQWGRPTLVVRDVDGNEIFFWLPHDDFTNFGISANASGEVTGSAT